ncbi:MAG: glycosyltransferase [Candidatus Lokiarchaeota archaeon]|nr:glycosyltransferase [Candidatus Lokiarchaeota archaeon]MBD3199999.1 glycosyltransferase [Candidatus Lokiarchaeota archaeon]
MKKKDDIIKVAIISNLGYPLYNRKCKNEVFGGGAAVQLYLISKKLAEIKEVDVSVITGNYGFTKNKIEVLPNGLKLHNIRPFKRKLSYYFLSLILFFFELVKLNPDVVIERGMNKRVGISALYCKLFRKRLIFSVANKTDVDGTAEKGFFGKLFKYGLLRADRIIAQNYEQISELKSNYNINSSKIDLIGSSYYLDEIKKSIIKDSILWIARAIEWKRPEYFIKLAKKFPKEKFIMICNKTDEKQTNVRYWKNLKTSAGKISNLIFKEYVPFEIINKYFENAKVFINTSKHEGFPNTFIQSFKTNTPVISLKVNPNSIFNKYDIGFVCKDDFKMMEKNLRTLITDNELYKKFSENAYNYVKTHHNINENIKYWLKIIKGL